MFATASGALAQTASANPHLSVGTSAIDAAMGLVSAQRGGFFRKHGIDVDFVVNQVVLPGREHEADACRTVVEARGLRWFPQLYKVDGGVADYPDPNALVQLVGTRKANTAPSYRGRLCWAGVDYFVVDKSGDAWSCRTAKRYDEGHLGNVFDGAFARAPEPLPCSYDICPCSVPFNRGMVQ